MSVSFPWFHVWFRLSMSVCTNPPLHVKTGEICVFVEQVDAGEHLHLVYARTVTGLRPVHCFFPSDLTQQWTLLPLRSIRIIYSTPSLSSRLMHGGVKHLVMLNHSGAQHARSHPEWQARQGREKKYHITLREREESEVEEEKGEVKKKKIRGWGATGKRGVKEEESRGSKLGGVGHWNVDKSENIIS